MVVTFHVLFTVEGQPTMALHNPEADLCRAEKGWKRQHLPNEIQKISTSSMASPRLCHD